jgi:outer membrane protein insertion porin family
MRSARWLERGHVAGMVALRAALRLAAAAALVLVVAPSALAQDISPYVGDSVVRVDVRFVEGQAGDNVAEFRGVVERHLRVGEPLAPEAVHESIAELVSSGLASRVEVAVEPAGTGAVAVLYRIRQQIRIAALDFDGVPLEVTDELRARLTRLGIGQRLTDATVAQGADEVVRYYQERGFFEVQARPTVELDETGTRATVTYGVERGEQARVSAFTLAVDGERLPGLEGTLRLEPGDPYTQADLEADIIAIRDAYLAAGYLAPEVGSPEVIRSSAANTVAIEVRIVAGPRVAVAVEGAEFSEEELRKILPVYTEGGLDEFQLSEGSRRLLNELQLDGYFFARVTHRVEDAPNGGKRVVYTVDPGRRFKVVDIDIEGTTEITHAEIADQLRSKERGFFFLSRGITSRELLERDSDYIERRLRAIGFRDAAVVERRLGITPDSDELVVTFVVEEGPRTRIADIMMRGNRVYARGELVESPAVEPGEFYSDADITTDANAILQKYANSGYVSAEVTTELVELEADSARLVYNIVEGRRARVSSIRIGGNVQTKESAIRQYLRFEEGEILKLEALRRSEQDLYNTNAFRQVIIRSEVEGVAPGGLDEERAVFVDVEEAKTWLMIYGGGFNTDDGPSGIFEISNVNLFGRLNTGALRLRASARQQIGEISYTNPIPFGRELPLLVLLRGDREEREAFTSFRSLALVQVQKKLDDRTGFFFRYQFERVIVSDLMLSEGALEREDRPVRLGSLGAAFYRDRLDNPFDPADGDFFSVDLRVAFKWLGGNDEFTKLTAQYKRFDRLPVLTSVVNAFQSQIGIADPFGVSRRVPISERFFSGGSTTLRGFEFEQAGPRDRTTGEPRGGDMLLILNEELRFPIYWRVGGVVFTDVGNVFRRVSDFAFEDLTVTVGMGLRFDTPVGPVRVDFGYLTNPPPGVGRSAVHVSFGQAF